MTQPAEYTEYYPTGIKDEILENEFKEIVSRYNETQPDTLIYAVEKDGNYWSIRTETKTPELDFHMYVVYDDEGMVITRTPEQKALVEEILDAIDRYIERLGYPGTARFNDDYDTDYDDYDDEED